jgi:hypothetical protein
MISDGFFLFFWIDFAMTEFASFILISGRLNRVQTAFLLV